MASVMEAVEVDVPVRTVYNQWTQFEEFPRFMEGVTQVRQIGDTHLAWTAEIAGATKEWTAEVTEQLPERRVKSDLARSKEFIESRGAESGAWRGEVEQDVTS